MNQTDQQTKDFLNQDFDEINYLNKESDQLNWSILNLLCCAVFGIPALISSLKAKELYRKGNFEEAIDRAKYAKTLNFYGICIGLTLFFVGIGFSSAVVAESSGIRKYFPLKKFSTLTCFFKISAEKILNDIDNFTVSDNTTNISLEDTVTSLVNRMPLRDILKIATELDLLNMTNMYDLIELILAKETVEIKTLKENINTLNLKAKISNQLIIKSLKEIQKSNWWQNILNSKKNSGASIHLKKQALIILIIFHSLFYS